MEWISVKEKLPPQGKPVLVFNKDRGCAFIGTKWNTGAYKSKTLDSWITYDIDGTNRVDPEDITHWMPLPEPPKQ